MERLTYKQPDCDAYTIYCAKLCRGGDCGDCKEFGKIIDRLIAYENTGLTPEDCAEYRKFEDEIIASGKTFGRLVDLLNADKEGRAVVLPCKVGDTVWIIPDGKKFALECEVEYVNIGELYATIVLCTKDGIREPYGVATAAFGKTVFLTREEAEEALRSAENG